MVRDLLPKLGLSLMLASTAGLLACPQLLSDDFESVLSTDADSCARRQTCGAGSSGAGGTASGSGGSLSAAGGSTQNAGGSGSAGTAGSGDAGGEVGAGGSGSAGPGGSGGAGGSGDQPDASAEPLEPSPACWLVALEDTTHDTSSNCLGINGWNQIETDPDTPGTEVALSYQEDRACFTGTIVNAGWGAVYNLTFNDTGPWDAGSFGVGGFQLEATGASLPPQIRVIYSDGDAGDFCRIITPGAAVPVPFASAHPGCSTSSLSVTDAVDLTHLRLAMVPAASDYAIDFCLAVRAIP